VVGARDRLGGAERIIAERSVAEPALESLCGTGWT